MTKFLLKSSVSRPISFTLLLLILSEVIFPTAALALTGGPSQPEVQSFEAISTSDMVDLFSGDFKYNIPLMDVEGYPLNIAYASGISNDQEASWVGLGWNLNAGNINRSMRGIPDDFKGDLVKKEINMKPNRTFGINAGVDFEIFGKESTKNPGANKGKKFIFKPSVGVAMNYNNYTGFGVEYSVGMGISAGVGGKGALDAGLGLHSSAASGLDISPNLSYSNRTETTDKKDKSLANVSNASGAFGGSFNTRAGLKQLTFNAAISKSVEKTTTNVAFNPYFSLSGGSPLSITKGVSTVERHNSSSGRSVNFGLQSYVPSISMPMINNSVVLSLKFSTQMFGNDADIKLGGFYSSQALAEKSKDVPAYGYMYSEFGKDDSRAMLDFNREKDASFSRTTKNLPITNFTYDVYNVTAQGMGGTFRPFRSDVGHVFDPSTSSISDSYSLGAELGAGNLLKVGIDVNVTDVTSTSGKWVDNNEALDYFQFDKEQAGSEFEPYYFKQVGEMSVNPSNTALYNSLKGEDAYGIRIQQGFSNNASPNSNLPNIKSKKNLEKYNYDNSVSVPLTTGANKLTSRQKRNQPFITLNKTEASKFGLQKNIYNATGVNNIDGLNPMKISSSAKAHHIAEINVINPNGSRYYYGLPVYNKKSKECSFNISSNVMDQNTGLVPYTQQDASINNEKGMDNSFNMTETPAYAYSYLLTSIVSSDYVDVNGNGPDNEDIGTYTKFHYATSTDAGQNDTYKWRTPTNSASGFANFSENSKSNPKDNTANYTYGEKELRYLDEIETKNYIAKFILSNRQDGFGVSDELGGPGNSGVPSKKIDKIILYSKPEYLANPSNAVPIKTVHFVYDYDLCKGVPNNFVSTLLPNETSNNGGKLTLKKVYFTYGKSNRAFFNQYQFTYNSITNPYYSNKSFDRWGNYMPSPGGADYAVTQTNLTNAEFPYADQNPVTANLNASAWTLNKITLPSGGEINVEYESDDYAYVQNMPAGQMFKVVGIKGGAAPPTYAELGSLQNSLYPTGLGSTNDYLVVNVGSLNPADFIKYYLKDISELNKQLFFKFLVNLTAPPGQGVTTPNFFEYVSGYADVAMVNGKGDGGLILNGTSPSGYAWIKLKSVSLKNKGNGPFVNPIAMTAIQFARLNYGNVVWGTPYTPSEDIEDALKQLAQAAKSSLKTMVTGFKNPNKALADKNYCQYFVANKSMVRLYNPNGKKLGGGCRVKKLYIDDKWTDMTASNPNPGQSNSIYGQEYKYETFDEDGLAISSGVASYEPMIGGEENSLKQPYYLGKNKWALLAPDDRYYVEGPLGESFYPSASVGYSKIKVQSIIPANAAISGKNGYKVYEFYTAKDYPTICKHTPIMPKQFRSPLKSLVKICSRDLISASQGYVIITNDMHGKAKAESDYAEGKLSPEKETKFFYKTRDGGYKQPSQRGLYSDASYSGNQLDNSCNIITKDGKVNKSMIGVDFDAIADFRESETETNSLGVQNNAASFIVGLLPIVVPTIWGSVQYELSRMRSSVLTKVVNQYGILDKTEVRIDKSTTASESLAFDAETGEVLVSKTTNDFEDPIYNVKYPAYWGYDLMGAAYKNVGLKLSGTFNIINGPGNYIVANASSFLNPGDELALTSGSNSQKVWVCNVVGSTVVLMDENANPVTFSTVDLTVLRSAKRNMINAPMQVLTCLKNPLPAVVNGLSSISISASSQITDTKATEYSDKWQVPKGYVTQAPEGNNCSCSVSPLGMELIWMLRALLNCNTNGAYSNPWDSVNHLLNGSLGGITIQVPYPTIPSFNYIQPTSTLLWRDPAITLNCPTDPLCNIQAGFNTNLTFNLTPGLLSNFEGITQPGCNGPQFVFWNGPSITGGVTGLFNNNDQIVGYLRTCDKVCYITLDFSDPAFGATERNQIYQYLYLSQNGPNSPQTTHYTGIGVNTNQSACASNEIAAYLILGNSTDIPTIHPKIPMKISSTCLTGLTQSCTGPNGPITPQCGFLSGSKVNPFVTGVRGNWRAKTNYTYLTDRAQTISSLNTDVRKDGYFTNYTSLFDPPVANGPWTMNTTSAFAGSEKWVNTVQTSKYNQNGVEIETKDALGRYSSALYGYNESLPIAVASNSQLREIAFDGFEDYGFNYVTCKKQDHFNFAKSLIQNQISVSNQQSHTGRSSLELLPSNIASVSRIVNATQQLTSGYNSNYCSYYLGDHDFIYPFSPVSSSNVNGLDYVISYWVKENYSGAKPLDYSSSQVTVTKGTGPAFTTKNLKRSAIIDGWQRVEYTFVIPQSYSGQIAVNLINNSSSQNVYFDDVRVHPYNSNMKSYVYHPVTLKYVAELDANNFATFYDYDEQGNLVRVKKETERGIMTIKESKTHYYKP